MTSHTLPRDSTAFDHIESLGGRDRYIERMREHGRRLAQLREAQQRRPSQLTTTRDVEGLRRTAPAPPPPRSGVDRYMKKVYTREPCGVKRPQFWSWCTR
mmetsp:Transcript_8779/g.29282  ORF Transcript_8779/g.29282 Transcript_8779/m.29282 type:complete len:100 (+) Transcript_8779:44-343(+)